jgi:hypothetical protein
MVARKNACRRALTGMAIVKLKLCLLLPFKVICGCFEMELSGLLGLEET